LIHDEIINRPLFSNIGQSCKKEESWNKVRKIEFVFSEDFLDELINKADAKGVIKSARKDQKMENEIDAEKKVIDIGAKNWKILSEWGMKNRKLSEKDMGILHTVITKGFASPKQCQHLLGLLKKMKEDGFKFE